MISPTGKILIICDIPPYGYKICVLYNHVFDLKHIVCVSPTSLCNQIKSLDYIMNTGLNGSSLNGILFHNAHME